MDILAAKQPKMDLKIWWEYKIDSARRKVAQNG